MDWNSLLPVVLLVFASAFDLTTTTPPPFRSRSTLLSSSSTNPRPLVEDIRQETLEAALAKMAAIMETDFASSFNKRRMRSVEVKESSIPGAGLGVFAKENIKAGTIIAFYPVHTLGIDIDESIQKVSIDETGHMTHEHEHESAEDQSYLIHILGNRPLMKADIRQELGGETIFIDVDLRQQEQPGFISHRINDGTTVAANSEEGVLEYYQSSRRAKNCLHIPFGPSPLYATVTTKKVKKGEELLTTYGCSYWLEALAKKEEEIDTTAELIVLEAKHVALDILKAMRDASIRNASEAEELQTIFDAP